MLWFKEKILQLCVYSAPKQLHTSNWRKHRSHYMNSVLQSRNQWSLTSRTKFEISDKMLNFFTIPSFYHFTVFVTLCSKYSFSIQQMISKFNFQLIAKRMSSMFQFQNLHMDISKYKLTTNILKYLFWQRTALSYLWYEENYQSIKEQSGQERSSLSIPCIFQKF